MAVRSAANVDSGVDTITLRLLEVGLDDTDYWQAQLRNHGVRTVASLKHLEGDTETYSSLTKKVRYKVEKKALAQLLNIPENKQDGPKSNEVQKKSRGKLAKVQSLSEVEAFDWEDKVQKFDIWSRDRDATPKQIEDRLEYVLKIKNDILSRSPHSNKSWVNDYLSQSALQNFLRSVMNSKLPSDNQEHIKCIILSILKKDELDQIDEHKFFAITELSDWASNKIVSPCMLKNITDFTTFEGFLKKILEQINNKECDSMPSHEMLANEVAEGINCLRSCYKQEYDDIFILILIHPFLIQHSNDAIALRPLTLTDLDALQKQFSQQRAKFTKYEKRPLLLQSYLFLLVIETMRNTNEKEVIDFIKHVSRMMQNLKPLEQKLLQQLVQNMPLADLKQMLQHNLIIPRPHKPSSVTSPPPQESVSQSTEPRPAIPRKPSSIAKPSPLKTPNPFQPPETYSKNKKKLVSQKDPAILFDKTLDMSLAPHVLLKKLGLHHCDSKKLQLQDALCIRPLILELSLKENPIADPSQLPYLVLHKLMSYDSHCRSDLLAEITCKSVSLHSPDIDFGDCGDPDDESDLTEEDRSKGIHPLDSLLAILICADDFLRQDLFSRLAKCQLAVPFILPDPFTKKLVIPLWALRTIINDWSSSGSQQMKQTHSMVSYPMPIVSVIRFGSPQNSGPSKSKILNDIISSDNCDRYFHRNCPGGHYKSVLVDGLVDMCWYLPAGKTADIFPDAITFLNLHGDARDHPHQAEFISQISSMCLVMVHEDDIEFGTPNMAILSILYSSSGGLTFLNGVGKSHPALRTSYPKAFWVNLTTKTDSQAKDMIQKCIKSRLETMKEFKSLEDICKGQQNNFTIDENSQVCEKGRKYANELIFMITNYKSEKATVKKAMLPLQGEKLWKAWALEDKELHRQISIESETVNEYTEKIKSRKISIRHEQLKHVQRLTSVMKAFIDSLIKLSGETNHSQRNYFLQCLKLNLNSLSLDNLSVMQQKYHSTRIEISKCYFDIHAKKNENKTKVTIFKKELESLQKQIIDHRFGLEHLFRELGQVYEAAQQSKIEREYYSYHLPKVAAELLIDGYPLELMDGDAAHVPLKWVIAVLKEAVKTLDNPNVFVLSVLGLQSTGKSTMLNTAFGLQFNASAGRCTRGAFLQLLKLDEHLKSLSRCDYVLVVDAEGLGAPEVDPLKTQKHDNELATFVIGLANMTVINIYGEIPGDMDDILQTSVHAFLRMNKVKYHPSCQFVHQNAGVNIKGEMGRAKLTQTLNKFTVDAAREEHCEGQYESFNDVIKFNDQTDVHYFPGLWKGDPPMAAVNRGYSHTAQALKYHLVQIICKRAKKGIRITSEVKLGDLSLQSFHVKVFDLWETLLKEKFVFSFKNTHEITAYNSLETQYSKWDWKFRSAMLDWEQKAENEITTEPLKSVQNELQLKLKELQMFVSKNLYDPVKSEMDVFFNGKQMETLVQWKGRFEQQLSQLAQEVKHHAEEHCRKLLENRIVITEFEKTRNRGVEFMKIKVQEYIDGIKKEQRLLQGSLYRRKLDSQQLQKLISMDLFSPEKIKAYRRSKIITDDQVKQIDGFKTTSGKFTEHSIKRLLEGNVLTLDQVQKILKQTHQTEQELQSKFDDIWKELVKTLPPVEHRPCMSITYEVERILLKFAATTLKGCDGQLISKIQEGRLMQADLEFQPQLKTHFTVPSKMFVQGKDYVYRKLFGTSDPNMIQAIEITKIVFSEARQYIQRILKRDTDFKPVFTYELLQLMNEGIAKYSSTNQCSITFTPEYNLEIYIRVCGFAIPKFQEIADSFKKRNDPRVYLEKHVKGPLFTKFKNQYKRTEAEEAIADTLCAYLKTPIRVQVERKLGPIMVDSMKASEHYFANKKALKVKILKDLYEKNEFQEYMVYLKNVRQSLGDHIKKYTVIYCDQKLPKGKLTRLQNSAREEVFQLIQFIENAVSQVNGTDIQTWMTDFCSNKSIQRELGVHLNSKELLSDYDTLQKLNLINFKKRIKEELQELKKTFEEMFSKITFKSIDWKDKPHELLKSLGGCTAQCPFCGEQCDLLEHDNDHDHRTEVHRIDCLAGWTDRDTKVMTNNVCPALVYGEKLFRMQDGEYHPCKHYKTVYKTWSIPPDVTSRSCSYWKWFVAIYKDRLAEEYDALPSNAPPQWSQIKWSEIKEDLERAYNVEI